jgi:hypothetical protein
MSASSSSSASIVQAMVDEAACFHLYCRADDAYPITDGSRTIGVEMIETWRRFSVSTIPASPDRPISAANVVGEAVAQAHQRWLFAPDDFAARPGVIPPPTAFDPSRSQRFTMFDAECRFTGGDGFRQFGTGRTMAGGRRAGAVLMTAITTIVDGIGAFLGHDEGTGVLCGSLSAEGGFEGSVLLRVMDRERTLTSRGALPPIQPAGWPDASAAYIVLRGEANRDDPVVSTADATGKPLGLTVTQGLKLQYIDCAAREPFGPVTLSAIGERVGTVTASVVFDPSYARGSLLDPIPFTAFDEFVFTDRRGRVTGTLTADSAEGRVFNTSLAGIPAIRFGGVGRVREGTGPFEGIRGLMTDNSVVAFAPHVSASVYVLRIARPGGSGQ